MNDITEGHPAYEAMDRGGGQCADLPGILRELTNAGYAIVKVTPEPEKPRFKAGDLVCLISGGPPMTVWELRADQIYQTCWFSGTELRREAFADVELRPASQGGHAGHVYLMPSEYGQPDDPPALISAVGCALRDAVWVRSPRSGGLARWDDLPAAAQFPWNTAARIALANIPAAIKRNPP